MTRFRKRLSFLIAPSRLRRTTQYLLQLPTTHSNSHQTAWECSEVFEFERIRAASSNSSRGNDHAFASPVLIDAKLDIRKRIIYRARSAPQFTKTEPSFEHNPNASVVAIPIDEHRIDRKPCLAVKRKPSEFIRFDLTRETVLPSALEGLNVSRRVRIRRTAVYDHRERT